MARWLMAAVLVLMAGTASARDDCYDSDAYWRMRSAADAGNAEAMRWEQNARDLQRCLDALRKVIKQEGGRGSIIVEPMACAIIP